MKIFPFFTLLYFASFNISLDDISGTISSDYDVMAEDVLELVVRRKELAEEMQKSGYYKRMKHTNLNK